MLRIVTLLTGIVALAQAAAVQPAIDCGTYPDHGPSDHTRYTTADGKAWAITCRKVKNVNNVYSPVTGSGRIDTMEQCIAVCNAGNELPGCNAIAFYPGGVSFGVPCYVAKMTAAQLESEDGPENRYSGAVLVQETQQQQPPSPQTPQQPPQPQQQQPAPLNCKDGGNSNGTIFTSSQGGSTHKYQILCNYQYTGTTLGASKRAETFEQCVAFCDADAACVDVVYSDAKYCWLKSSKGNGYYSPNWWSAIKVASDA